PSLKTLLHSRTDLSVGAPAGTQPPSASPGDLKRSTTG
ncbi:hypothetical protein A2U01_0068237, partial [Trifolium medium]|nr:hypothetical protein [Trifolium medium]